MNVLLRESSMMHIRLFKLLAALGSIAGIAMLAIYLIDMGEAAYLIYPAIVSFSIYVGFTIILRWQIEENLFGEIGFLYMSFTILYTLFPFFTFFMIDFNPSFADKISYLLPNSYKLGIHLWRHVIFIFGVAVGYLAYRGRSVPEETPALEFRDGEKGIIFSLIILAALCIVSLTLASAPVETYIDNYIRYDHLSWLPRKLISMCVRFKLGFYTVLLVFLFRNYKRYRKLIPVILLVICLHEISFSLGARIESLMVLLMVLCLYHYFVKRVTFRKGLIVCAVLATIFSGVELYRSSGFDFIEAKASISDQGLKPATEFGAVYFTSYHLYEERGQGTMAAKEWPMFFSDFFAPITWGDFTRWNPQYWYARNYFPDAVVPPETMGPIADSAIWGGEVDLLIRSIINGVFFAYVVRWFLKHRSNWWSVIIYTFFYATCVVTLKYSVFYHLAPLVKTLMPTIIMVWIIKSIAQDRGNKMIPQKVQA